MSITIQNTLPLTSKVWVYQSDRDFNNEELQILRSKLLDFNATWAAHGTELNSSIEVYYNRFIVFFVDESGQNATGCSIDKSVGLIKSIESEFSLSLLDRMNVLYWEGQELKSAKLSAFKQLLADGSLNSNTRVFNNLVKNKEEFLKQWECTVATSWQKNLLVQ